MANSIQLKNGTTNLYPVTSDTLVYDSNGINLNQKITDINNTTLKKSDLSDSVTNTSSTTVATSKAVKQAYDRAEQAFQLGNNAKQSLVDTLIAKGSEIVSTSNSWEEIIEMINKSNINLATPAYTVEDIEGVKYNFILNADGWYESTNQRVDSSYSMCKLVIPPGKSAYYYLECINYAEKDCDYGIISKLNQTLPLNSGGAATTSSSVLHTFYGKDSMSIQTVNLGQVPNGGFFYIKFVKDGSLAQGYDSLRFRVKTSKEDSEGYSLSPGEIEIFDGYRHASEIGGGYNHISSSYASNQSIENGEFKIYAQGSSGLTDTVYAKQAINLTNYTTLEFTGMSSTPNNSNYTAQMGFYANGDSTRKFVAYANFNKSTSGTSAINVNNLNGEYILAIRTELYSGSSSVNVCISNITLE